GKSAIAARRRSYRSDVPAPDHSPPAMLTNKRCAYKNVRRRPANYCRSPAPERCWPAGQHSDSSSILPEIGRAGQPQPQDIQIACPFRCAQARAGDLVAVAGHEFVRLEMDIAQHVSDGVMGFG